MLRPLVFLYDRSRPSRHLYLVQVQKGLRRLRPVAKKHLPHFGLISQLAKAASSRPEAKRSFSTADSFSTGRKRTDSNACRRAKRAGENSRYLACHKSRIFRKPLVNACRRAKRAGENSRYSACRKGKILGKPLVDPSRRAKRAGEDLRYLACRKGKVLRETLVNSSWRAKRAGGLIS